MHSGPQRIMEDTSRSSRALATRSTILVALILIATANAHAQQQGALTWEEIVLPSDLEYVYDVSSSPEGHVLLTALEGEYLKPFGEAWRRLEGVDLHKPYVLLGPDGLLLADGPDAYHYGRSTDLGESWLILPKPPFAYPAVPPREDDAAVPFIHLAAVDSVLLLELGSVGMFGWGYTVPNPPVMRSLDRGLTWDTLDVGLKRVYGAFRGRIWGDFNRGNLAYSDDLGETWVAIPRAIDTEYGDPVDVLETEDGALFVVVGSGFRFHDRRPVACSLIQWMSGAQEWIQLEMPHGTDQCMSAFAPGPSDALYGAAPDGIYVLGSGRWSKLEGSPTEGGDWLLALPDGSLVAVERYYGAFYMPAGAAKFERVSFGRAPSELFHVLPDGETFLSVQPIGLYRSADAGRTWRSLRAASVRGVSPVTAPDGRVYIAREKGGIHASADGGQTWEFLHGDIPFHVLTADADGRLMGGRAGSCVAEDGHGSVYVIEDSELTAIGPDVARCVLPRDMVTHPSFGLAVADSLGLFISPDGGASWSERPIQLRKIAADGAGRIYAVPAEGSTPAAAGLLVSTDGAESFETLSGAPATALLGIERGVVIGTAHGEVLQYEPQTDAFVRLGELGEAIEAVGPAGAGRYAVRTESGRVYLSGRVALTTDEDVSGEGDVPRPWHPAFFDAPYPNPARSRVYVPFDLPAARVRMTVVNVLGQVVETLMDGVAAPGERVVVWNAASHAPGIYFLRMEAAGRVAVRAVVVHR